MNLMDFQETEARLNYGESPLDLSIENWERLLDAAKRGQSIGFHDINGNCCALCLSTDFDCKECSYFKYYAVDCNDHHWEKARTALFKRENIVEAFQAMLDALIEVKDNQ